jgi:hypothetical protein
MPPIQIQIKIKKGNSDEINLLTSDSRFDNSLYQSSRRLATVSGATKELDLSGEGPFA